MTAPPCALTAPQSPPTPGWPIICARAGSPGSCPRPSPPARSTASRWPRAARGPTSGSSTSRWRIEGNVHRFIFANKNDSDAFHAAARQTTDSLRRTQASDLAAIRTVKLRLVRASGNDNADTLATRMGTLNRGRELFLVVNNLLPGDPVESGAPYKVVRVE